MTEEFIDVEVNGVPIDAYVFVITGPDPDHMDDPSKQVDIPFLRISDANNAPRWYIGVRERDLESITDESQVAELETTYNNWREHNKDKLQ